MEAKNFQSTSSDLNPDNANTLTLLAGFEELINYSSVISSNFLKQWLAMSYSSKTLVIL